MKKYQRGFVSGIGDAIVEGILVLIVLAFAAGALMMWLLPKVWDWLKPFIHAWTA